MTSRRITVVLLCACLAIPALMFVRDVGASPPPATVGQASFDARRVLHQIVPRCDSRCSARMIGQSAPHVWRFRLSTATWHACYDLDPHSFRYSDNHGFDGVTSASCRLS
jgi:hypothetical protein